VQDAALVGVADHPRHGGQQPGGGPPVVAEAAQVLGQTATFNEPHAEEVLPLVLADLVNGHDVRVVQVGGRFRLHAGALHRGMASRPGRWPGAFAPVREPHRRLGFAGRAGRVVPPGRQCFAHPATPGRSTSAAAGRAREAIASRSPFGRLKDCKLDTPDRTV
jgi:hypothetical protein